MRKQFTFTVLTAGFAALLGSLTLSAQDKQEVADIPFAFHANTRVLPAGKYRVQQQNTSGLFQLFDAQGHSLFVPAPDMRKGDPAKPKLTFACYGSECLLSQISMAGDDIVYAVTPSTLDKELTRKVGIAALVSVRLTPQ